MQFIVLAHKTLKVEKSIRQTTPELITSTVRKEHKHQTQTLTNSNTDI